MERILVNTMEGATANAQLKLQIVDYYFNSPQTANGLRFYSDHTVNPKVLIRDGKDPDETVALEDLPDLSNLSIQQSGGIEGFSGDYSAKKGITYSWSFDAYSVPDSVTIYDNTGNYVSKSNVSGAYSGTFQLNSNSNGVIHIEVAGSEDGTVWDLSVSGSSANQPQRGKSGIHDGEIVYLQAVGEHGVVFGNDIAQIFEGTSAADHFVFDTDTINWEAPGMIYGFSSLDGDKIVLSAAVFGGLKQESGVLADANFIVGKRAKSTDDHIIYRSETGQLFYDRDGKDGAKKVLFAELAGATDLSSGDFVVAA